MTRDLLQCTLEISWALAAEGTLPSGSRESQFYLAPQLRG